MLWSAQLTVVLLPRVPRIPESCPATTAQAEHCTGWVTVGRRTCMLQCRDSLTSITYIYGGKED